MPQISLIIPLYNAEKYLRPCLDSVAAQTFKDFEVLCVDDGSKDATAGIVREYCAADGRFKLISQENAGCSAARNNGLKAASAPFVALLDQDDALHPQAFEVLYFLINKYGADIAAFKHITVPDNFVMGTVKTYEPEKLPAEYSADPLGFFFRNPKGGSVLVWNRLYRRSAVEGAEFPVGIQPAEDTVYTLKAMFLAKSIVYTDTELLFYRDSSTSVMNQGKTAKYIKAHAGAARVMYEYFIKSNVLEGERKRLLEKYITRFVFKSLISQPLRLIKGSERPQLLSLAHSLAAPLFREGICLPGLLGWRKNLASKLFLNHHFGLARILV